MGEMFDEVNIVLAEDDEDVRTATARVLRSHGFSVEAFPDGQAALECLIAKEGNVDIVLSDLHMPRLDGLAFLREVRQRWSDISFLVLTGDVSLDAAYEAIRAGAYDYLHKPLPPANEFRAHLLRAVERRRLLRRTRTLEQRLDIESRFEGIVGRSPAMRAIFQLVESVAVTDASVLVLGESGTGKELVARAIHARSRQHDRAFVAVNCSALSETLLESELFGHAKGAFTGATNARRGLFEEASGSTLFLDEIGDISPAVQVRLLRAIQEGEIKPVGANETKHVDVRLVAATHRNLRAEVDKGTFREDLYYRLNVVSIELPPLRERLDDVPLLIEHSLTKYAARFHKPLPHIDEAAMQALTTYTWPGNVRELDNAIQRAVALAPSDVIGVALLPPTVRGVGEVRVVASATLTFSEARTQLIERFEKSYLEELLRKEDGNLARASRHAGLDKSNLRRLLKRHAIDVERFRTGESD